MTRAHYWFVLPARRLFAYARERRTLTQLCKVCGRAQAEVDFTTSAEEWSRVVPTRFQRHAVCLACFERFAGERGRPVVKVFLVNGPL